MTGPAIGKLSREGNSLLFEDREDLVMSKISKKATNDFCPQTLFLYGTNNEDGSPDFGLFCWFSYVWDGEMGVMCCIGGDKLTRQNIEREKFFSANLVTEKMLPLADHFGNVKGEDPDKMKFKPETGRGEVLPVPILEDSPVVFELEVKEFVNLHDGEVIICKIRNVLQDEELSDPDISSEEKLAKIAPVRTTCTEYFSYSGKSMGKWGEPRKNL